VAVLGMQQWLAFSFVRVRRSKGNRCPSIWLVCPLLFQLGPVHSLLPLHFVREC
jgi:hypothetical protein